MIKTKKPTQPVYPDGMDIVFKYKCPHCQADNTMLATAQPALAQCGACGLFFPIVPIDGKSLQYIKIMLANGKAAVDPDFL